MPHLLQMDSASKQVQRTSVSVHTTPDNLEYQYRSLQMTNILDTVEPTERMIREGMKALLQCSASDLDS